MTLKKNLISGPHQLSDCFIMNGEVIITQCSVRLIFTVFFQSKIRKDKDSGMNYDEVIRAYQRFICYWWLTIDSRGTSRRFHSFPFPVAIDALHDPWDTGVTWASHLHTGVHWIAQFERVHYHVDVFLEGNGPTRRNCKRIQRRTYSQPYINFSYLRSVI